MDKFYGGKHREGKEEERWKKHDMKVIMMMNLRFFLLPSLRLSPVEEFE